MLRLDSTLRKIQILLSGIITTAQLPVMVMYSDRTSTAYSGAAQLANTNSTTAVDICAAPAASTIRDIDYISVRNSDTVAATATIRYNDNTTLYTIVTVALAVGDQLVYVHGDGWRVVDSTGQTKTTALSGLIAANITLSGSAVRILGPFDWSGVHSARTIVQTSTLNNGTSLSVMPNGTATGSQILCYGSNDPDNATVLKLFVNVTETRIEAFKTGTGTYGDLNIYTSNVKVAYFPVAGGFVVATATDCTSVTTGALVVAGGAGVAGSAVLGGSLTVGTGGNYLPGSYYSDANWGFLIRAKQASPAIAQYRWADSVDAELLRISNEGCLRPTALGTVSLPVFAPQGDTNTGMYFSAADTIDWATAGTQRLTLGSTGQLNVRAATASTSLTTGALVVAGGAGVAGTVSAGGLRLDYTNTATVGAVIINKASGRVNIAAAGTSVVVTNSLVTAASHVMVVASTNDATARVTSVVPAAGSFTINTVATTAQTSFDFVVFNAD